MRSHHINYSRISYTGVFTLSRRKRGKSFYLIVCEILPARKCFRFNVKVNEKSFSLLTKFHCFAFKVAFCEPTWRPLKSSKLVDFKAAFVVFTKIKVEEREKPFPHQQTQIVSVHIKAMTNL